MSDDYDGIQGKTAAEVRAETKSAKGRRKRRQRLGMKKVRK